MFINHASNHEPQLWHHQKTLNESNSCNKYNTVCFGITFCHKQEYMCTKHGLLNLVRANPHLLQFVWISPLLINLVYAGCCLLTLVWAGRLMVDGRGYGAALVRHGRGHGHDGCGCDGDLVGCCHSAGQGSPFPFFTGLIIALCLAQWQGFAVLASSRVLVGPRGALHG